MLENVKFTAKPPIRSPWNYQNWQIFFDKESKSEEKTKFRKKNSKITICFQKCHKYIMSTDGQQQSTMYGNWPRTVMCDVTRLTILWRSTISVKAILVVLTNDLTNNETRESHGNSVYRVMVYWWNAGVTWVFCM